MPRIENVEVVEQIHIQRIRQRLHAARELGRRRRMRAKLPPMIIGLTSLFVGTFAVTLALKGAAFRLAIVETTLTGLVVFLLSVLPTERRTVTAIGVATLAFHMLATGFVVMYVVLRIEHGQQKTADTQDAKRDAPFLAFAAGTHLDVEYWCLSAEAWAADQTACAIRSVHFASGATQTASWALGSAYLTATMARYGHGRPRLDALYLSLGCNCILFGIVHTVVFIVAASIGGPVYFPTPPASLIGHAAIIIVGALSLRPALRASLIGWLAARGEAGSSAVAISSLMGAGTTEEVLARSRALLRAVSAEQLRASDFMGTYIAADTAARTRPAHSGEIDAFVSHSWQADPGAKWDELVDWCDEFKRQHGRWPLLWIDRFCVGSHDVPMSIACLPVFVSSCNTMLVLFDETFLSRLWCIVELWCFLAMGGDPASVVVRVSRRQVGAQPSVSHGLRIQRLTMSDDGAVGAPRTASTAAPPGSPVGRATDMAPSAIWRTASRAAERWRNRASRVAARLVSAVVGMARASRLAARDSLAPRAPSGMAQPAGEGREAPSIEALIARFHVQDAVCSSVSDRNRLLDLVETYPGGLARFHVEVRAMLLRCDRAAPGRSSLRNASALIGLGAKTRSRVTPSPSMVGASVTV